LESRRGFVKTVLTRDHAIARIEPSNRTWEDLPFPFFSNKRRSVVIPSLRSGQALSAEGAKDLLFTKQVPSLRRLTCLFKSRSFATRACGALRSG
jgi:hypothetical protein